MPICDFHLSETTGAANTYERQFGNRLLAAQKNAAKEWKSRLDAFLPRADDLRALPDGSWLLEIRFRLSRPYASKSEEEFHPWEEREDKKTREKKSFEIQNPIVRDHLTGLPMVRPTTWKGHLLAAARTIVVEQTVRDRLFGTILGTESGQAGRLHFFPTFFTEKLSREVVTPLSRDTRTPARGPIDIEVVPAGREGRFCLLYVPRPKGQKWEEGEVVQDLVSTARAVQAMLLEYGFSAKKTAGFGVVDDKLVRGVLTAKGTRWPAPTGATIKKTAFEEPEECFTKFMDEKGRPSSILLKESGDFLSNSEYKQKGGTPGSLSEYKKFKRWYEVHGAEWARRQKSGIEVPSPHLYEYEFSLVSELLLLAKRLHSGLEERTDG